MANSRIPAPAIQEHLQEYRGNNQLGVDADYDTLLVDAIDYHITNKFRPKKNNDNPRSPFDRYLRALAKRHRVSVYLSEDRRDFNPAIIKILLDNLFASLQPRLSSVQNIGIGENDAEILAAQKQKARAALRLEVSRRLDLMFASATLDKDDAQTTAHIAKVLNKRSIKIKKPAKDSSLDPAAVTGTAAGTIDNVTTLLGRAARIAGLILEAIGTASQSVLETIDSVRSINGFVGLASAFLYFLATPVRLAATAYKRYRRNKIFDDLQAEHDRLKENNQKMSDADRHKLKHLKYEIKHEGSLLDLRGGIKWSISGVFLGVSLAAAFAFSVGLAPFYTLAFPIVATAGGLFALYEHVSDYRTNKKAMVTTAASIESTKAQLDKIKENLITVANALTDALTQPSRNEDHIRSLKAQITDLKTEFKTKRTELRDLHVTKHEQNGKQVKLSSKFAKAKTTIGMIIPIISIVGAALTLSPPTVMIGVGILVFAGAVLLTMFALQMIHNKKMGKIINAMVPEEETISLTEDLSTDARLNHALAAAPINQAQVAHAVKAANNQARAAEPARPSTLTEITARAPGNDMEQVTKASDNSRTPLLEEYYTKNTGNVF
jgi:hypothetical protein